MKNILVTLVLSLCVLTFTSDPIECSGKGGSSSAYGALNEEGDDLSTTKRKMIESVSGFQNTDLNQRIMDAKNHRELNQIMTDMKTHMTDRVDAILPRGERISLPVERTDTYQPTAMQFKKSTRVKRSCCTIL